MPTRPAFITHTTLLTRVVNVIRFVSDILRARWHWHQVMQYQSEIAASELRTRFVATLLANDIAVAIKTMTLFHERLLPETFATTCRYVPACTPCSCDAAYMCRACMCVNRVRLRTVPTANIHPPSWHIYAWLNNQSDCNYYIHGKENTRHTAAITRRPSLLPIFLATHAHA